MTILRVTVWLPLILNGEMVNVRSIGAVRCGWKNRLRACGRIADWNPFGMVFDFCPFYFYKNEHVSEGERGRGMRWVFYSLWYSISYIWCTYVYIGCVETVELNSDEVALRIKVKQINKRPTRNQPTAVLVPLTSFPPHRLLFIFLHLRPIYSPITFPRVRIDTVACWQLLFTLLLLFIICFGLESPLSFLFLFLSPVPHRLEENKLWYFLPHPKVDGGLLVVN